ncbi:MULTISPECIES: response regulator [Leptospira]|uniref:Response regulator receiver domain protein n=7 Tax=Leptospira borgpetersenii TaxID=174 RepID=M3HS81_LEPBO|nr:MULTISPECIES: response regulator [Leptospira]EMG00921.1 response regulator receiver domain protein [Leptospira borgpetersenii str. 200701203]EMO10965.1 response regulator receiver domain protein [Leptospira borgpetersenii str. Noumea 25]EMO62974.1 response regulator receiver domain protein [Leptospira borgpetersenii serovar Pomona str. 200901868]ABJ78949.1 Response regulator receiver domain [Leptospira borgpetersenii serovar Hardjo-bovis str. L550]ALO25633.1 response regulator receiver doma
MKRILIVDDSAVFRKILNLHLSNSDFDILEAVDGQDGLDKLQSDKVDLIVSDMNMPNMDGITFVKEIKKDPKNKFTPIIMLTTESQTEVKNEGLAAGARAWLTKPFSPEELVQTIHKLLP